MSTCNFSKLIFDKDDENISRNIGRRRAGLELKSLSAGLVNCKANVSQEGSEVLELYIIMKIN